MDAEFGEKSLVFREGSEAGVSSEWRSPSDLRDRASLCCSLEPASFRQSNPGVLQSVYGTFQVAE